MSELNENEMNRNEVEGNESADIISVAQEGIRVNSKIKKLKKELDEAKEELRSYASMIAGEARETVEIETPDGNVQVVFTSDRIMVRSNDTETVLEIRDNDVLSETEFNAIFREVTSFKVEEDYEKALSALTPLQRERVEDVISVVSPAPSVRFPNV